MAALDAEEARAKEQTRNEMVRLKTKLSEIEIKLAKLLDVYLADALSAEEYTSKKTEFGFSKTDVE